MKTIRLIWACLQTVFHFISAWRSNIYYEIFPQRIIQKVYVSGVRNINKLNIYIIYWYVYTYLLYVWHWIHCIQHYILKGECVHDSGINFFRKQTKKKENKLTILYMTLHSIIEEKVRWSMLGINGPHNRWFC
jgi:hypothetical protein